jgi:5-formyltetrahydrofolate cyclo-ligase
MNQNNADKAKCRQWLKKRRQEVFDQEGPEKSAIIAKRVIDLCREEKYRCVMCYISFGSEVDTLEILEKLWLLGKTVCVPKCLSGGRMEAVAIASREDLLPGKYGILEPRDCHLTVAPSEIDLCLVPGLGFSEEGGRIGFGAGFYDRFLSNVSGLNVGITFDEMVSVSIPQEGFDQRVDLIITDKRVIEVDKKDTV